MAAVLTCQLTVVVMKDEAKDTEVKATGQMVVNPWVDCTAETRYVFVDRFLFRI